MEKSLVESKPSVSLLTPSANMDCEVAWDSAQVASDLRKACLILSERGLKIAAKFASELWMGLTLEVDDQQAVSDVLSGIPDELLISDNAPSVFYAKSLLELGEYLNAAAVLSRSTFSRTNHLETMPPAKVDLSAFALYLRAYALYMAGERRKEEDALESSKTHSICINPFLQQLLVELFELYESGQLDAFGLYVFGMVLRDGENTVLPPHSPSAHSVLIESIIQFPLNWSAWLDLAACAIENRVVERDIESQLQPILSGHYMYHFFCAHLHSEHQSHAEASQIYERWMDPSLFGNSPYLLTQFAVVQYQQREFSSARRLLEDLHNQMPHRLDSMDLYSNILYVQEDGVALSKLAHTAVQVDKYRAETCCIVGNYYSLKQQRAKAILYFQRALKIDRSFTSAWTLMGHEYVEWKQTASAMEAYRRAVQVNPSDYRAWYGLGQTYEFLNMSLYALYYYKQAAQLRPYDSRMWCALGTVFSQLERTADAIRAYERALQHDDTEGVATQKLATLYKQVLDYEKAAQCYFRHLKIRHQVTRPSELSTESVDLETMLREIVVEGPEAEAILFLASYYKDNGEYDSATAFSSRLLEYPGQEKDSAMGILKEIRSRKLTEQRVIHTRSMGPVQSDPFYS